MATGDFYYTLPLSLLHSGSSSLQVLNEAVSCGIVNTGLGCRQVHGEAAFQKVLWQAYAGAQAQGRPWHLPRNVEKALWEASLVGAQVLGIQGGDRHEDLLIHQQHTRPGQVFFRVRHDWMWNAVLHARNLAGIHTHPYDKPFTWREFRIIAALLSAKVNKYDFTFLGWESIQARACGFHSKALFQAALAAQAAPVSGTPHPKGARTLLSASGGTALPAHCQPLTRDMIRHTLDKLESLGFFARVRYSTGPCGGYTAYSFRHPQRADLIAAVQKWAADNATFKTKTATHRAEDLAAFRQTKRIANCA
ncbi:MAG TPA: hypothetical protein VGE39_00435 [Prosthecobacter sp.]